MDSRTRARTAAAVVLAVVAAAALAYACVGLYRGRREQSGQAAGEGNLAPLEWHQSLDEALAQARRRGTLVLADVSAPWCGWCQKLEDETFTDERVRRLMAEFALVRIDWDSQKDLARGWGAPGPPTTVILDPAGAVVARLVGYRPAAEYLEFLRRVAGR